YVNLCRFFKTKIFFFKEDPDKIFKEINGIFLEDNYFFQGNDFIKSAVFSLASLIDTPFFHSFSKSTESESLFLILLICSITKGFFKEFIHSMISFFSTAISILLHFIVLSKLRIFV